MTANLTLSLLVGLLFGTGISLLLARGIVRSFLGVVLVGNGINLLFLLAGSPGRPAITKTVPEDQMSDPLPQAMTLTAIVITLALTGFVLAMAHRSWQLLRSDVITDDEEDARIHALAVADDLSHSEFAEDEETDEQDDPGGCRRAGDPEPAGPRATTMPTMEGRP